LHDARVSKAFTRDDGPEAAPVPRRRAPLPAGSPNYVTSRGLAALRDELAQLDAQPPAAEPVEREARAAWRRELEHRIGTAELVPPPEDRSQVRFGARVTLRAAEGATRELQIVGVDEADAARGLVAFAAPVAKGLLGRRLGESATLRMPGGAEDVEIIGVEYE
jgi:transcription elongation factor GreB